MRAARTVAASIAALALVLGGALALLDPEPLTLEQARARIEGSYAELPDGALRYRYTTRDARLPLLVFVHGGALNSLEVWNPLVAALDPARYGFLRFDSYGQGYSARPGSRHDAALYVRALDGLLALERIERPVHLVGYSLGGLIAAEYAAHRPERIASLTLIAPAGLGTRLRWPVRVGAWPVLGEAVYRLRGQAILLEGYTRMSHATRYRAHVDAVERPWLSIEGTGRSMLSQLRSLPVDRTASAYAFVAASDLPVLAVFGADDETVPASNRATLAQLVPAARIQTLTSSSHALVQDDASRLAPLISAHVDSAGGGGAHAAPHDAAAIRAQ